MRIRRLLTTSSMAVVLAGCDIGNMPPAPTLLDLGPPTSQLSAQTVSQAPLGVPAVSAVGTLQTKKVIWRISGDGQPNAYATVGWTAPPSVMVRERLFERLSRQSPVLPAAVNAQMAQVRTTLLQFEHVFSADGRDSEGVVTLQVVLVRDSQVLGQFRVNRRVLSQNNTAEGGARALRTATDEAVNEIAQWVAKLHQK